MWLVTDWLINWQDGWPAVDWVNDLLNCLLIDWLTEFCFIDLLAVLLTEWLTIAWLTDGLTDWLADWLTDCTDFWWLTNKVADLFLIESMISGLFTNGMTNWLTTFVTDSLTAWLIYSWLKNYM